MFAPKVPKAAANAAANPTNSVQHQRLIIVARRSGRASVEPPQMLQRTCGNQTTQRTQSLPGNERNEQHEQKAEWLARKPPVASWDFSKISVFPTDRPNGRQPAFLGTAPPLPNVIQPKLIVGAVDDPLEREADRMAEEVMRIPDPEPSIAAAPPHISRKCAACEEEEISQTGDDLEREADRTAEQVLRSPTAPTVGEGATVSNYRWRSLQARETAGRTQPANVGASVIGLTAGGGQPLPATVKAFFEPRFRHNFSQIRVHADARAVETARAVNALAYTAGHNLVFGEGQYAPGTREGQRLLAHELTHVVQQQRHSLSSLQRKEDHDKDKAEDKPKDAPKDAPKDTSEKPPEGAAKNDPKGVAKNVAGPCGGKPLASSITESDKRLNGSAIEASLGADEFGNTSKLGADFKFSACKVGTTWRFQLGALVVPVTSKVQPEQFRINIGSASDVEVTKGSYSEIVSDLSPTTTATFSVSCGTRKEKDKVTAYSRRNKYWNHQFVIDHEAFHREKWVDMYKKELAQAESEVAAHSIPEGSAKDAAAAVAKAQMDLTKYMTDAYQRVCDAYNPGKESRAYDHGAPAYQKLVDQIKARATKEKW